MSEVQALLRHYAEVRNRLRYPLNAVPDTGINLRRNRTPPPEPEKPQQPKPKTALKPSEQSQIETYKTSFCRKDVTFKSILKLVAAEFGLEYHQIMCRRRTVRIVFPRQIAFYIANKNIHQSLASMARYMGMDHTSILHGRNKVRRLVAIDHLLCGQIAAIEGKLFENYPGLTNPAICEQTMASEPGPCSQIQPVFSVDNSGGPTLHGPKERSNQDVEGELHCSSTGSVILSEAP